MEKKELKTFEKTFHQITCELQDCPNPSCVACRRRCNKLVELADPWMFGIIRRISNLNLGYTLNKEGREVISQEAWLSLFDKMDSFNRNLPWKPWAAAVIVSKVQDFCRRMKVQRKYFSPLTALIDCEINHAVQDMGLRVERLIEEDQIILHCRGVEKMSSKATIDFLNSQVELNRIEVDDIEELEKMFPHAGKYTIKLVEKLLEELLRKLRKY